MSIYLNEFLFLVLVLLLKHHLVLDATQLSNADLDDIPVVEVLGLLHTHSDTTRCTSEYHSTSLKRSSLADKANNLLNTKK